MDDHTRRDVDEACLRLLDWTELEWVTPEQEWGPGYWKGRRGVMRRETGSPSQDAESVVPLAEALRARGHHITMTVSDVGRWYVAVGNWSDVGDTLPEAIARAAARAVGTETKE